MILSGKRIEHLRLVVVALLVTCWSASLTAEELPSIEKLVKPKEKVEEKKEVEKKPQFPRDLKPEEILESPAELLPADPLFYFEAPNGRFFSEAFAEAAISQLVSHEKAERFFKDNPLDLKSLFSDLPGTFADLDKVALLSVGIRMAKSFAGTQGRLALAGYIGKEGLELAFLVDAGSARKDPFDILQAARDAALKQFPDLILKEAPRGDDYLDKLSTDGERPGVLLFGMARNFVVVSIGARLGADIASAAAGKNDKNRLGSSSAFVSLPTKTGSDSHLRGFISQRSLLAEARKEDLPGAQEVLDFVGDIVGRGKGKEVVYYDLRVDGADVIEHLISPVAVEGGRVLPGIPAAIAKICAPPNGEATWSTAKIIPYQPQPDLLITALVKPQAFVEHLTGTNPFGGSDYAKQIMVPSAIRHVLLEVIGGAANDVLRGEVAIAIMPEQKSLPQWICAMSVRNVEKAEALLGKGEASLEMSGVKSYSIDKDEPRGAQSWALFSESKFRPLGDSFIVVTSSGALMETLIGQVTANANMSQNKDYAGRMAALGKGNSLACYVNVPAIVNRSYVSFSQVVNEYFPRIHSLNSRPPMNLVTGLMKGIGGGVSYKTGDKNCKITMLSPMTIVPAFTGSLVMKIPRWVRDRSRQYLTRSRVNLQAIWIEMQNDATNRGHYPGNIDDLRKLFPPNRRKDIFISPAAVNEVGLEEAARRSYSYVTGLRSNDEPDKAVLYESEAWHYEYEDMLFMEPGQKPRESGRYLRCRLVLRLDGTIKEYSEEVFKQEVLPLIKTQD